MQQVSVISGAFNHALTCWLSRGADKHTCFANYNFFFFYTKHTHCRMVSGLLSTSLESPALDPMILGGWDKLEAFKLVGCDKLQHECSEN